ncbi:hypothetical protein SASPL_136571 [Salvia splendens]|uniref:Uncharacterized protein n=1 Tax=Salvia splendens TaxID=180675 RepID=A0A8X8WYG2_SALSN|nr:hypothetical protein SASPL_136571 [Salvia splendens]
MALRELFRLMATMEIGEFVPWLSWISRVNGFYGRVEKVREELDEFLEMVVEEHLSRGLESGDGNKNNENFVDILLKDSSIDRDGIKGILLEYLDSRRDRRERENRGRKRVASEIPRDRGVILPVFIREEETALLLEEIDSCCLSETAVDLSQLFDLHSNNVICRAAFGRRFVGRRFAVVLRELFRLMATVEIGEFVPWLSWISRVNGFNWRVEKVREEGDEILEMVVEEHISRGLEGSDAVDENKEFFLDILLKASIDRDGIKAILLDMLAGGTDTTSSTLEWAMTELIRHPTVMMNLQTEVRGIVKDRKIITDEDLGEMQYLKAVIKETLRLHAPAPLLGRVAREDVTVMGYEIPANMMVITNVWAIGRDPASWEEPHKFHPERFLNSSLDFKGLDFRFSPFGHGRRGCPGIALAIASVEVVLANLVHKFEWKLPMGAKCEDLDVMEQPGVDIHRKNPLLVVPTLIGT